eukprot:Skav233483  [mRNA]  locus=scaffold1310:139968:142206:+ [translate_table: standard]
MSNARPVKVESLQLLTLQESALKDACSAESIERGGGWLLEHVRRRRSGLMEELQHQIQCEKDPVEIPRDPQGGDR